MKEDNVMKYYSTYKTLHLLNMGLLTVMQNTHRSDCSLRLYSGCKTNLPVGWRHLGLGMTTLLHQGGPVVLLLVLWGMDWGTGPAQEAFDKHLFIFTTLVYL